MKPLIFKYRGLVWGIFAAAVLVCPVSFSVSRTAIAVPFLAVGQLIRFWAAGFIPKYRTLTIDAPELVTEGPYAWVRNPLYAGNALMGCGWALMAGWLWLPAFLFVYLALYCLVIIPCEEDFLREKFGDLYDRYLESTPSLVPSVKDMKSLAGKIQNSRGRFDRGKSWSMERHSLRMNALVTVLVLLRLFVLKY